MNSMHSAEASRTEPSYLATALDAPVATLTLSSGRRLCWAEMGAKHGRPLLFLHASGSSKLEAALFHDEAVRSGFRILSVDRPGIGASDFSYATSPRAFCADLLELMDSLALPRVGVLTLGLGAVFGLALASIAGERVEAQLSLGAIPAGPLLTLRDQSGVNGVLRRSFATLVRHAWVVHHLLDRRLPREQVEELKAELGGADRRALESWSLSEFLTFDRAQAVRQGGKGPAQDESIGMTPFDYRLPQLDLEVEFWQGGRDGEGAGRSAELIAQALPRARSRTFARQGYYFFLSSAPEIFARLHTLLGQAALPGQAVRFAQVGGVGQADGDSRDGAASDEKLLRRHLVANS